MLMPEYCNCRYCKECGIHRCLGCNGFHNQWITKQTKSD